MVRGPQIGRLVVAKMERIVIILQRYYGNLTVTLLFHITVTVRKLMDYEKER